MFHTGAEEDVTGERQAVKRYHHLHVPRHSLYPLQESIRSHSCPITIQVLNWSYGGWLICRMEGHKGNSDTVQRSEWNDDKLSSSAGDGLKTGWMKTEERGRKMERPRWKPITSITDPNLIWWELNSGSFFVPSLGEKVTVIAERVERAPGFRGDELGRDAAH